MDILKLGKIIFINSCLMILILLVIISGGCQGPGGPRLRAGAFWGSPIGMDFPEPEKLGKHSYEFTLNETNGMLYTCKGGFIDIGHVRESADRTAYLGTVTYQKIIRGNRKFSFKVIEPSRYWVTLSYPKNWNDYSKKEKRAIANEVSISLGQYLAHTSLVWHEILTWYGFSTAGIFPDTISAFSPEDTYSDILGTRIAVQAMRDENQPYDEAMTKLLAGTLRELDVQSAHIAKEAAKKIDGQWYTGGLYFFVHMKKRNLDVGLDDFLITPWLVSGICPDAEPRSLPLPGSEFICDYGFDFEVEIEPRVLEKSKIYHSINLAGKERIRPQVDFPKIISFIDHQENGSKVSFAVK